MTREEMKRRRKKRRRIQIAVRIFAFLFVFGVFCALSFKLFQFSPWNNTYVERTGAEVDQLQPEIQEELLTPNRYSRPGIKTERIRGIVIHYTANPGSSAMQNRNYFEGLKDTHLTEASSHFVVGLEGEIIQCVPLNEVAYASNNRNLDTISVETCHWEEDGAYTDETYESMVQLTAWLCKKYDLTEQDIIRHYDIKGKICPKYFVDHEDAWEQFKMDVKERL